MLDPEAGGCAVHFLALRVCGVGKEEKPSWWWRTRQGQYAAPAAAALTLLADLQSATAAAQAN